MSDYATDPAEVAAMTQEMHQVITGGRAPVSGDDMPFFTPDMPVGSQARMRQSNMVVRRVSEFGFEMSPRK